MNTPYYTAYNGWEIEHQKLIAELAALHKVVIDAKAILSTEGAFSLNEVLELLDTAPEPSDETLAAIEAADNEGADNA